MAGNYCIEQSRDFLPHPLHELAAKVTIRPPTVPDHEPPEIVHTPSKDQCEKKIGDVTGDGKLVERFFTIGESSVNSQDGINTGKESNNDATETMEQMKAGIFELVEQMKQMKRFMASGPHYIGKRIDEANYRLNRRVASLEVQGKKEK
ncbi:hypothetical protein V3C99_019026 [Haemonchus contortus]|uniref:Uncharacterized protein n=1 Tax=Haemonchus contortus TaxID=6289 RepID=A0A7I4YZV3_HAECO